MSTWKECEQIQNRVVKCNKAVQLSKKLTDCCYELCVVGVGGCDHIYVPTLLKGPILALLKDHWQSEYDIARKNLIEAAANLE